MTITSYSLEDKIRHIFRRYLIRFSLFRINHYTYISECGVSCVIQRSLQQLSCYNNIYYDLFHFYFSFAITIFFNYFKNNLQVTANGSTPIGSWESVVAIYVSKTHVQCILPKPGSYLVSVVNRVGHASNSLVYITFNPSCFVCDVASSTCSQKVTQGI